MSTCWIFCLFIQLKQQLLTSTSKCFYYIQVKVSKSVSPIVTQYLFIHPSCHPHHPSYPRWLFVMPPEWLDHQGLLQVMIPIANVVARDSCQKSLKICKMTTTVTYLIDKCRILKLLLTPLSRLSPFLH